MRAIQGAVVAGAFLSLAACLASAENTSADAIVDRGIRGLGGKQWLAKFNIATWKSESTFTIGDESTRVASTLIVQGIDHFRQEFVNFGSLRGRIVDPGEPSGVSLIAGNSGVQKFGESDLKLDKGLVEMQKRLVYLTVVPVTLLPLKSTQFHMKRAPDAKVNGKLANGIKAVGPDKRPFRLYFDKSTGLPARLIVDLVTERGLPTHQETTYNDYRWMSGVQKATRITVLRDGKPFVEHKISEFAFLHSVDPATFTDTTLRSASLR